jgi:hypothetical protein
MSLGAAKMVGGMPTAASHEDWPLRGEGWRQIIRGQRPQRRPQTVAMRHDWDDEFGNVTTGLAASTPRTSGATFCGAVPRLGSFGVEAMCQHLSPEGGLLFTGTASADAMKDAACRPQPLTRDRRSVARVGDKFFGDSVLEGGPRFGSFGAEAKSDRAPES